MIRVVTDSSCDLPSEVLEELGIVVVPLVVRIGREEFLETDLEIDEFWAKVSAARAQGLFPQTSQPSLGAFESVFATLVGAGNEVVCVTITSKHSGTFNTAWAAAQRFGEAVGVIDSWSTSLSLGFLAMAAARAAREGASLSEVLTLLREMRARTHLFAVLDTIEYIRMGGRANAHCCDSSLCAYPHLVAGDAVSGDQAHRRVCRGRIETARAGADKLHPTDILCRSGKGRTTDDGAAALGESGGLAHPSAP